MTNPYLLTPLGLALGCLVGFITFAAFALLTRRLATSSLGLGSLGELFPAFSLVVPGRQAAVGLHTRSYGTPADPLQWKSSQFVEEFEAHIAETYLQNNSEELLAKEQGVYKNETVHNYWILWCNAIALTYAKTRPVSDLPLS